MTEEDRQGGSEKATLVEATPEMVRAGVAALHALVAPDDVSTLAAWSTTHAPDEVAAVMVVYMARGEAAADMRGMESPTDRRTLANVIPAMAGTHDSHRQTDGCGVGRAGNNLSLPPLVCGRCEREPIRNLVVGPGLRRDDVCVGACKILKLRTTRRPAHPCAMC